MVKIKAQQEAGKKGAAKVPQMPKLRIREGTSPGRRPGTKDPAGTPRRGSKMVKYKARRETGKEGGSTWSTRSTITKHYHTLVDRGGCPPDTAEQASQTTCKPHHQRQGSLPDGGVVCTWRV